MSGQINSDLQEELKKKMSMIIAVDRRDIAETSIPPPLQKEKMVYLFFLILVVIYFVNTSVTLH